MIVDLATARQWHLEGRYADAARSYHALIQRDPQNAGVLHLFGMLHHQNGYHDRAIELIGRAIALRSGPEAALYYANLAEVHRSLGQFEQAAECCRSALRLQPGCAEAANNLGLALHDLGRHAEAVEQYRAALQMRPDNTLAQNNLGISLRALGKAEEAMQAYRDAIALDPQYALPRANLGQMLTDQGKAAEALPHCQEAVRLDPAFAAGHNNLGNALRALERWGEAREAYAEAVRLKPDLAIAHANLGSMLRHEGKVREALPHLRRAVELAPDDDDVCKQLIDTLAVDEDWVALLPYAERRVKRHPDNAGAHCDLGWAYQCDGRLSEAEREYREALRLQPEHLDARINLGDLQEERGQMAEAEASFREAEARHPGAPAPLARRALLQRGRLPEADRDRLRFALYRPDLLPGPRAALLFALAHVADGRGDHAEAAACLAPANALTLARRRAEGILYDPDAHTAYVDRLIEAFTPELFARLADSGDDTLQPVFVCGMPRSGTTLVEQILASHSQVFGAGELPLARRALDAIPPVTDGEDTPVARVHALDTAAVRKLAGTYRNGIRELLARPEAADKGSGAARVVDKMPDNYLHLGLLALLFPRATVIHVRRDYRDVALSCWMTNFRVIPWADDIDHLARRCREHQRIMEHWRRVLPRPIHEVQYEELVENFEPEARRLVAACGLEWEPACLQFYQTCRPVRTASVTQVRQPLYRQSAGRWRAYETHLASLFQKLVGP